MKFSVIIPIHNKLPHLERSINSVLNQTFQDFEILLIDDASTDGSNKKIKEFKDQRISIYIRTEPGPGGYAARNMGIEKARGEWVAFLDADDEWYPHHLTKMNELSSKFPNVYFMSCGWETKSSQKNYLNTFYINNFSKGSKIISIEEYLENGLKSNLPLCTIVSCIKTTSPITNKLFPADSGAKRGGDLYAWLKLICFHKEMAWSNHIGAIYHIESVNMVTKKSPFSIVNLSKRTVHKLSVELTSRQNKLLRKYTNYRIKNDLKASKVQGLKMKNVIENIHFQGDFKNALIILLLWVMPVKLLSKLKRFIKL